MRWCLDGGMFWSINVRISGIHLRNADWDCDLYMTSSLGHFHVAHHEFEGWPILWATGSVCMQVRELQICLYCQGQGQGGSYFTMVLRWVWGYTVPMVAFCTYRICTNWPGKQCAMARVRWSIVTVHAVIQNRSHACMWWRFWMAILFEKNIDCVNQCLF